MDTKRNANIDILKAIGIILMIMGHQVYGDFFDHWIHGFHMQMFLILSGFLYRKSDHIVEWIGHKVKRLLVPYLFLSIFHLVVICILKCRSVSAVVEMILEKSFHIFLFNYTGMPICGAVWFLTALFFLDVLYRLIDCLPGSVLKNVFVCMGTLTGICLPKFGIRLPLCFDVALMGLGFYWAGTKFRSVYEQIRNKMSIEAGVAGISLGTIGIFINSEVNVRLAQYGNVILFYICPIIMTASLYVIVEDALKIRKSENFLYKQLTYIGQNSMVYVGFNQLVLAFLKKISFDNDFLNAAYRVLALIICLAILRGVSEIFQMPKFRKLIGRL